MQVHVASSRLATEVTVAPDSTGREHLIVITKATWSIPGPGQRPRPLAPEPVVMTDQYFGAPGESPLRYGADIARFKPRCDVLFDASAHAPRGVAVPELVAGFALGPLVKHIRVTGPRRWQGGGQSPNDFALSEPESFLSVPLHAGLAFGGARWFERDGQRLCDALQANPVGVGYAGPETLQQLAGQPAPQLSYADEPLAHPDSSLRPAALSGVGRHWMPRRSFAGTFDEAWQRDVFPLLPRDHDEQFNQCAPQDQQMPHPRGGEPVRLYHLMPDRADVQFKLPRLDMQVRVLRTDYSQAAPQALVDTLFFDLPQQRFTAVWRASVPLRRRIQEISQVAIGPIDPVWWERQRLGGGCAGCADPAPESADAGLQEA